MRLGCIADDLTGATDLASHLSAGGLRTVLVIGVPAAARPPDADAVVVALKSRTIAAADAVAQSLAAARWLGAAQLYFKYCSTFDSTDAGNLGPVIDALLDHVGAPLTVAVPALPDNGRTVYMGHLFVGDRLLSESGMEHHPLTPMTDPDLVRVLGRQTARPVALVDHATVSAGAAAIRARLAQIGAGVAIVDAVSTADLEAIGAAVRDLALVTGGSGLALGLAPGTPSGAAPASPLPPPAGACAVVAGSCAPATNRQVRDFLARGGAGFAVDPRRLAAGADVAGEALAWASARLDAGPVLVSSTDDPDGVARVQATLGTEAAGALVEDALAAVARGLVERGVRRLVIAGGETSGACVAALGLHELAIGAPIDPGAPWCFGHADGAVPLHVALKSGNFGADDFFTRAFATAP